MRESVKNSNCRMSVHARFLMAPSGFRTIHLKHNDARASELDVYYVLTVPQGLDQVIFCYLIRKYRRGVEHGE